MYPSPQIEHLSDEIDELVATQDEVGDLLRQALNHPDPTPDALRDLIERALDELGLLP